MGFEDTLFGLWDYGSLFVVLAEGLGEVSSEDVVGVVGANMEGHTTRDHVVCLWVVGFPDISLLWSV